VIRNVIFDWSGTLVDDLPAVWRATNHVFRLAGVPELTLERFRAEFCLPFTRFYERYVPHVPLAQLEPWFHEEFRRCDDRIEALPRAHEFLAFCRAHSLRTLVLSSVHGEHYGRQAERTGLGRFIDHPYPQVWDKTAKIGEVIAAHGLDPRATLLIGDMVHDLEAARRGGLWSCAVLTGYTGAAQLRTAAPDLLVEHLGELQVMLEHSGLRLPARPAAKDAWGMERVVATVGGLIFNEQGEVLMVRTRKWSNRWGIPGGKIRYGEPSEAALRRELLEETGLEVREIRFVMVQDCIHSEEFYREAHFLLLNYTCRCGPEPAVRLNEEAEAFQWVVPEAALRLELNQPTRRLLAAVMASAPGSPREG
jgi:phosphoglycolate phosphatase-like HAD superfamily hydrolase/ADP-ribose pyrophosphatase YjhB (NUDIX family)